MVGELNISSGLGHETSGQVSVGEMRPLAIVSVTK